MYVVTVSPKCVKSSHAMFGAGEQGKPVNLRMPGDRRGAKVNDSLKEAP
jgi:hypothetical protein